MQSNLITDYLDINQDKCHPRNFQITLWKEYLAGIKFDTLLDDAEYTHMQSLPSVPLEVIEDKGWFQLAKTYKLYMAKGGKPYVFSSYLSNILQNTSVNDLKYEDFPDEFYGYIELPGLKDEYDALILGLFICIYVLDKEKTIKIIAITDEGKVNSELKENFVLKYPQGFKDKKAHLTAVNWLYVTIEENETFLESLKKVNVQNTVGLMYGKNDIVSDPSIWRNSLLNAIVFIKYCQDNMIQRFNDFATKKSKADVQKKLFTKSEFTYCDLEKKIFNIDSTFVKGHFRWQPYGVKRSKKRLIYIAPGKRTYNKKSLQN